jgi:hypothetical protein
MPPLIIGLLVHILPVPSPMDKSNSHAKKANDLILMVPFFKA